MRGSDLAEEEAEHLSCQPARVVALLSHAEAVDEADVRGHEHRGTALPLAKLGEQVVHLGLG